MTSTIKPIKASLNWDNVRVSWQWSTPATEGDVAHLEDIATGEDLGTVPIRLWNQMYEHINRTKLKIALLQDELNSRRAFMAENGDEALYILAHAGVNGQTGGA